MTVVSGKAGIIHTQLGTFSQNAQHLTLSVSSSAFAASQIPAEGQRKRRISCDSLAQNVDGGVKSVPPPMWLSEIRLPYSCGQAKVERLLVVREKEARPGGIPVITSQNAAQLNQVVTDIIEGVTTDETNTPDTDK